MLALYKQPVGLLASVVLVMFLESISQKSANLELSSGSHAVLFYTVGRLRASWATNDKYNIMFSYLLCIILLSGMQVLPVWAGVSQRSYS